MVRLATEKDLSAIMTIRRQVHMLHVNGRPDIYRMPENAAEFDQTLLDSLETPDMYVFVVDAAGAVTDSLPSVSSSPQIVGYAVVQYKHFGALCIAKERTSAFIDEFGVDEAHRHHGYGRELMNAILAHAKKLHADDLALNVWSFNKNAEAFYNSFGMIPKQQTLELPL